MTNSSTSTIHHRHQKSNKNFACRRVRSGLGLHKNESKNKHFETEGKLGNTDKRNENLRRLMNCIIGLMFGTKVSWCSKQVFESCSFLYNGSCNATAPKYSLRFSPTSKAWQTGAKAKTFSLSALPLLGNCCKELTRFE